MSSAKRLLVVASVISTVVLALPVGNSDGRAGRQLAFAEPRLAAQSPPKVSPIKARPRDGDCPGREDLAEDEMRNEPATGPYSDRSAMTCYQFNSCVSRRAS